MDQLLPSLSQITLPRICDADWDNATKEFPAAECVLRIIEYGSEKIKIALLIPQFIANHDLMVQCMDARELQRCMKHYEAYLNHSDECKGNLKQVSISLIELIDLFCENKEFKKILPEYDDKIPEEYEDLINAFMQLKNVVGDQLKISAMADLQREKAIHGFYHDNEKTIEALQRVKKELRDQEISLRWKLTAKHALIKKFEDALAAKRWDNNLKIKQEILKSSFKIRDFMAKSLVKQENLAEMVEKAQMLYEKTLKTNLKQQKDIRDEKNKLLLQLQGLLRKYDQNIGDKMQENSRLQILYDEHRQRLDDFLVDFRVQEEEYITLAQKKLDIETEEFQTKLSTFVRTRAAKIIQRFWRAYLREFKPNFYSKKGKKNKNKNKKNK